MHQLGLSAAEVAELLHARRAGWETRLAALPEPARLALCDLLAEFASELLEANNKKLTADLVRLGVLPGTITRGGEASF